MRGARVLIRVATLVIVLVSGFPPAARSQPPTEKTDEFALPPPPPIRESPPAVSGAIVIDEDMWTAFLSDEPGKKAKAAVEALKAGDGKAARENVLKMASHVHIAAARSDGDARDRLIESLEELKRAASEIRGETLRSPEALSPILARALQALSYHHAIKASRHWLNGKGMSAGYDLQAAEMDLRDALAWAGREPETPAAILLNEAEALSVRLIQREKVGDQEVTAAVTGMTRQAAELGDTLRVGS